MRAYRRNLNSLEMLAQSKVISIKKFFNGSKINFQTLLQTRLTPSKVSVAPTVYPFVENSGLNSKIEEKMPFQSLPVIIPPTGVVRTPKHMRKGKG